MQLHHDDTSWSCLTCLQAMADASSWLLVKIKRLHHAPCKATKPCGMPQAIDVEHNGKTEGWYLCVVEEELNAERLRSAIMSVYMTIHTYMFSHTGHLLYANTKATERVKRVSGGCAVPALSVAWRVFCACVHPRSKSGAVLG